MVRQEAESDLDSKRTILDLIPEGEFVNMGCFFMDLGVTEAFDHQYLMKILDDLVDREVLEKVTRNGQIYFRKRGT